ncbi:MAG: acylphosphatase [Candidatus Aenigmatarchaeota archaeon]
MNARVHLLISGKVQGVFFRANTRKVANEIGVTGWVRNVPNGMVEVVAEGRKNQLDRLIEFCKKGPEGAKVEDIEINWEKYKGEFKDFEIKF